MASEDRPNNVTIPGWAVEGFKLALPVVVAVISVYIQIQSLETRSQAQAQEIKNLNDTQSRQDASISKNEMNLSILLEKHNNLEKNINTSLNAISDTLKEMRTDIKNLGRSNPVLAPDYKVKQ